SKFGLKNVIPSLFLVVEETLKGNTVKLLGPKKRAGKRIGGADLGLPKVRRNALIEIISINTGCLNSCTYCKTKHARGDLASYPIDEIVARFEQAFEQGIVEVWLTSEDTGAYGRDIGTNIVELLNAVVKTIPEGCMMRIGMTNPPYILEHLEGIAKILNHPRVYSFLHVPVQSGSDAVLNSMRREYNREDFCKVVDTLRANVPDCNIATDIIAGFPTETEEDFDETISLCEKYKFPSLFMNQFFPRPGTPAAKWEQIPRQVIKERTKKLSNVFKSYLPFEGREGERHSVLITEMAHDKVSLVGHTKSYHQILVKGNPDELMGKRVDVVVYQTTKHSMLGRIVSVAKSVAIAENLQIMKEKQEAKSWMQKKLELLSESLDLKIVGAIACAKLKNSFFLSEMSRSMQNLLREFRALYEERLKRLDLTTSPENYRAKCEVYQHYVHDLLEQNDALINALKDSEIKGETSADLERSLTEELSLAKGFEEQLFVCRQEKIHLEVENEDLQEQAVRLREQLDDADNGKETLENAISIAHDDLAKLRIELDAVRGEVRDADQKHHSTESKNSRIQSDLRLEQAENAKLNNRLDTCEKSLERAKSENHMLQNRLVTLENELNEKSIELAGMERELISFKVSRDTGLEQNHVDKQEKLLLSAKVNELEKELRPLREELTAKGDKLVREKDLSIELASTISRLRDQITIQVENSKKLEKQNVDLKRKLKESQTEVDTIDKRRTDLTSENQKIRENLHKSKLDIQRLRDDRCKQETTMSVEMLQLKEHIGDLQSKIDRRTRETEDLSDRVGRLTASVATHKVAEKTARDHISELQMEIADSRQKIVELTGEMKNYEDRILILDQQLHDRDVEMEALRSSFNNKAAECEEQLSNSSKQEQLVHELTTELSAKNAELRRSYLDLDAQKVELTNNAEKIQHMALKIQTQEEVISIAKGEIEDYERMKPHPESEVINLNSKLDQLRLEGDYLKVKHAETSKKLADVSCLCNELRNKLKSAVGQRDQAQQLTNLYEGKFSSAERQLKELEFKVHQAHSQVDRERECAKTRQEAMGQRIKDISSARLSSEEMAQQLQREISNLRAENSQMIKNSERDSEKQHLIEKELHVSSTENERLATRLNDSRIEIDKLTKLVEDLTTNCENLQRQRRESDSLLRNLRGELGIACKTRKAAEAQMETYRSSIKSLEEQISTHLSTQAKLEEQLKSKAMEEDTLKSKKRTLKSSVNDLEDQKRALQNDVDKYKRNGAEQRSRVKQLEEALRAIRRETETHHTRQKHEQDKLRKQNEQMLNEQMRKVAEFDSKTIRYQEEVSRLTDVISKLQVLICRKTVKLFLSKSELETTKTQLSASQRLEHQSRADLTTIREAGKSRDERRNELQVSAIHSIKQTRHLQCEYDSLQRENSRLMGEMARHIKEKEMAVSEEDRLRKHSLKQQAMLQEMRRKLASKAHYQDLKVHYQPHTPGPFGDSFASHN
ncbi:unnamed protein product, partial [Oikopleura dioica]